VTDSATSGSHFESASPVPKPDSELPYRSGIRIVNPYAPSTFLASGVTSGLSGFVEVSGRSSSGTNSSVSTAHSRNRSVDPCRVSKDKLNISYDSFTQVRRGDYNGVQGKNKAIDELLSNIREFRNRNSNILGAAYTSERRPIAK